jgi:hypothetical protein
MFAHGLAPPPQLQGRTKLPAQLQQVGGEHVGRPPRAMVHDRPARHAYDRRDPRHWDELHGTIEGAPSRRAGRPKHRHARDATIRCIRFTIRNADVKRPDARDPVARDRGLVVGVFLLARL